MLYAAIVVLVVMGFGASCAIYAFFWAAKNDLPKLPKRLQKKTARLPKAVTPN